MSINNNNMIQFRKNTKINNHKIYLVIIHLNKINVFKSQKMILLKPKWNIAPHKIIFILISCQIKSQVLKLYSIHFGQKLNHKQNINLFKIELNG